MQGGTYSQVACPKTPYTWNIACQSVGPGYSAATLMVRHNTVGCTAFSCQNVSQVANMDGEQGANGHRHPVSNVRKAVLNSPNGVESTQMPKQP